MSAAMARRGGRVQQELSDMRLASNMAKMANGTCSPTIMEELYSLMKKPHAKVREVKKRGVECVRHPLVKAAIEIHRPCLVETRRTDAFLAKMAPHRIRRHAGDSNKQVHLHVTDADSRLQSRRHLCPECRYYPEHHPRHPVTMPQFNIRK